MEDNYCVYQHTSPSGKAYIGITNNVKRRWGCDGIHYMNKRKDGRFVQQSFARALVKYGWINFKHEILFDNLSKEEAQAKEVELINIYKKQGLSYNIANGGEGVSGIKHPPLSEERRAQISAFMKEHHPMKGKHHTEEAREKISQAGKGRKMSEEWCRKLSERMTGKPLSETAKQKLREHKKAHPEEWIGGWNALEVHQYDLSGNYVASYKSLDEAAMSICGKHQGSKIGCIFKDKIHSAFGYFWSLEKLDSYDVSQYDIVKTAKGARVYLRKDRNKRKSDDTRCKHIEQYAPTGELIATYNSIADAVRATNVSRRTLSARINGLHSDLPLGGYIWKAQDNLNESTHI